VKIVAALLAVSALSSCAEFTLRVPLGDGGKYGYVQNTTKYVPPVDFVGWQSPAYRDK